MSTTVAGSTRQRSEQQLEARRTRARAAASAKRLAAAAADISGGALSPVGLTMQSLHAYIGTLPVEEQKLLVPRIVQLGLEEAESQRRSERAIQAHARKAKKA